MPEKTIKIGISSCLLGNNVRYDGANKYNQAIVALLGERFELVPFCPEVEIGMGVPRDPMRLELINDEIHCVDIDNPDKDMTEQLAECANRQHWLKEISGYIFKARSPSCGVKGVSVFNEGIAEPVGQGIYAAQLIRRFPGLPVAEEDEMENQTAREMFITKVMKFSIDKKSL